MYLGHSLSYGDTVVQDNFYKIKIVIKKLDCFGSNEPHNDAQQVVSRHVIARSNYHLGDEAIHCRK